MTWIKTKSTDEDEDVRRAIESQRALYPSEYSIPIHPINDCEASPIVASHSLIPAALYHAFATFGVLMQSDLPLTRRQRGMIATVVSVTG